MIDYDLLYHSRPDCIQSATSEEKIPCHWSVEKSQKEIGLNMSFSWLNQMLIDWLCHIFCSITSDLFRLSLWEKRTRKICVFWVTSIRRHTCYYVYYLHRKVRNISSCYTLARTQLLRFMMLKFMMEVSCKFRGSKSNMMR